MDFALTPEEQDYKKELLEFLKKEMNEGVVAEVESMEGIGPYGKELIRKMGKRRLLTPSWPEKYGGRGLSYVTQAIMTYELSYHQGPFPIDAIVVGPPILHFGTDRQKEKFLPRISTGEIDIALGYTEPGAGSDLASVQLRAVEHGDYFILNGQKIYNTEAHHAEYHWLLTRTDTSVPKHKGMSLFIVDLKSPGITVRPLRTSAGLRTNEVFYEDVRVPKEDMIGGKNNGWDCVNAALGGERASVAGDVKQRFDKFIRYLIEEKGYNNIDAENSWIPDELAEVDIRLHLSELLSFKAVSMLDKGHTLIYEPSVIKLYLSETRRQLFNAAMEILGHYGELSEGSKRAPMNGVIEREYLDACRWTIVAGSSEIQRYVIALRGLGLPRK